MSAIETMEEELSKYGLTMEDIEPEDDNLPKWLKNWKEGKRLNTFEQGLKEQALREKQKAKERERENDNYMENTSTSDITGNDNSDNETNNNIETENKIKNDIAAATENNSIHKDSDVENNSETETELDPLEELFQEHPRKDDTHTYRGFYLENSIVKIIDKKSKKGGKGMKSKIVNEALKIVFKEKGWMD